MSMVKAEGKRAGKGVSYGSAGLVCWPTSQRHHVTGSVSAGEQWWAVLLEILISAPSFSLNGAHVTSCEGRAGR